MKRLVIFLFTYLKKKQFDRSCQDIRKTFFNSWEQIYQLLILSPYWSNRLKSNLEDNPLTEFQDYSSILKDSLDHEFNPLNGEKILFWAQSGGTSGASKYFPITSQYLQDFQETIPAFVYNLISHNDKLFSSETKVLYLVSSMTSQKSQQGVQKGYLSTFNYINTSPLLASSYVLPVSVFNTQDHFTQRVCLYALSSSLSSILSVTPLAIDLFMQNIKNNWFLYLDHLKQTSLIPEIEIISLSSARLKYLMQLKSEDIVFHKLWPTIQFLCCWKTSVCENQSMILQKKFGEIKMIDAIYSATEGWMNIPMGNSENNGGPVNLKACLLEFIDLETNHICKPWELKVQKKYEVIITNSMGLVRYQLKDIILCTGFYYESPIIEFVSKKDGELSLGMAVISEHELIKILSHYVQQKNYIVCPNEGVNGLILYTDNFDLSEEVLTEIDQSLQNMNANYKTYRLNKTLDTMKLVRLQNSNLWSKENNCNFDNAQKKPKFLYQSFPTWIEKKDTMPV